MFSAGRLSVKAKQRCACMYTIFRTIFVFGGVRPLVKAKICDSYSFMTKFSADRCKDSVKTKTKRKKKKGFCQVSNSTRKIGYYNREYLSFNPFMIKFLCERRVQHLQFFFFFGGFKDTVSFHVQICPSKSHCFVKCQYAIICV